MCSFLSDYLHRFSFGDHIIRSILLDQSILYICLHTYLLSGKSMLIDMHGRAYTDLLSGKSMFIDMYGIYSADESTLCFTV